MMASRRRSAAGTLARAALVPPAAFTVHQLRFLLAYGKSASAQLTLSGHSYLHSLAPWLVALIGLALGLFLRAFAGALQGHRQAVGDSRGRTAGAFVTLWLTCTVALLTIYTTQELLEGSLIAGHLAGLQGAFGFGGWWAIPASAGVGLVLASIFHSASTVLAKVAQKALRRPSPARALPASANAAGPRRPAALPPVESGWSMRGPPLIA